MKLIRFNESNENFDNIKSLKDEVEDYFVSYLDRGFNFEIENLGYFDIESNIQSISPGDNLNPQLLIILNSDDTHVKILDEEILQFKKIITRLSNKFIVLDYSARIFINKDIDGKNEESFEFKITIVPKLFKFSKNETIKKLENLFDNLDFGIETDNIYKFSASHRLEKLPDSFFKRGFIQGRRNSAFKLIMNKNSEFIQKSLNELKKLFPGKKILLNEDTYLDRDKKEHLLIRISLPFRKDQYPILVINYFINPN